MKNIMLIFCLVLVASSYANACESEVYNWIRKGATESHKKEVVSIACRGGSYAPEVKNCMQNAWNWLSNDVYEYKRDFGRLFTARACSGNSSASSIKSCLTNAWSWLDKSVRQNHKLHGRRIVAAACSFNKPASSVKDCLTTGWNRNSHILDRNERRRMAAKYCRL